MERRGFIEDDDGFKVEYSVKGNLVFYRELCVGHVDCNDIAYEKKNGNSLPIGKVYWEDYDT